MIGTNRGYRGYVYVYGVVGVVLPARVVRIQGIGVMYVCRGRCGGRSRRATSRSSRASTCVFQIVHAGVRVFFSHNDFFLFCIVLCE